MQSDYQDSRYGLHLDELADLDAWEGYEFWSAQLEAKMEFLADLEHVEGVRLIRLEQSERKGDVLPF
ncbi:MAG TPA: hypothetical protein VNI02_09995 [Blastocatellia bacterium]|nr:hypothetical protein [Blastocatellia bacterium]